MPARQLLASHFAGRTRVCGSESTRLVIGIFCELDAIDVVRHSIALYLFLRLRNVLILAMTVEVVTV